MLEQLKCLIKLQILEDKKNRLLRSRDETPKRLAKIAKEFERLESEQLLKQTEYENAKKTHRSLEQGIADLELKINRSRQRMNEVKTNKEYQAILKEIEDLKKDIRIKEDRVLETMERLESMGGEIKELEKQHSVHMKQLEQDREQLRLQDEQLNGRLERLEALQRQVREKLEADLLKRCDDLLVKRSGIAVAPVQDGICQICHLNIPPQKYIELQRDEIILQCPHCHRFIYWPGHEAYGAFEEDLEELNEI